MNTWSNLEMLSLYSDSNFIDYMLLPAAHAAEQTVCLRFNVTKHVKIWFPLPKEIRIWTRPKYFSIIHTLPG